MQEVVHIPSTIGPRICRPERGHSGSSVGDMVQHEVVEFRQCTVGHSRSQAKQQGQFFHLQCKLIPAHII